MGGYRLWRRDLTASMSFRHITHAINRLLTAAQDCTDGQVLLLTMAVVSVEPSATLAMVAEIRWMASTAWVVFVLYSENLLGDFLGRFGGLVWRDF